MRIGIAKPDFGIEGGFELNLGRIQHELEKRGHTIDWLTVDVAGLPRSPLGVAVPDDVWERGSQFFLYAQLVDAFRVLDASDVDVVLTTQPPSYAVEHPRKLALFYHHHRVFYDLSEVYVRAGFARPIAHLMQQEAVRAIDRVHLPTVEHFLAGSHNVARRLQRYSGIVESVSVFEASLPQQLPGTGPSATSDHVLCVSRHEFPKRTELFVHAMKFLPDVHGLSVGRGGRLRHVQRLDAELTRGDPAMVDPEPLWLSHHAYDARPIGAPPSNVAYRWGLSAGELADAFRRALCVVAPAYDEDYGHTAMEGMEFGKPVVTCTDSGGLADMVDNGVTGFVVEPTGEAIATAVARLRDDPDLAAELGQNGHEKVQAYTWDRAMRQFQYGLEQVAG
ncbi:MAG: glycosyltransferase family 4 protein [Actinomycetota bacterium]|nr:glycosyltransferase family 4 protein [Actinomycetota bacterium]